MAVRRHDTPLVLVFRWYREVVACRSRPVLPIYLMSILTEPVLSLRDGCLAVPQRCRSVERPRMFEGPRKP